MALSLKGRYDSGDDWGEVKEERNKRFENANGIYQGLDARLGRVRVAGRKKSQRENLTARGKHVAASSPQANNTAAFRARRDRKTVDPSFAQCKD